MTVRLPGWVVRWQPRSLQMRFSLLAVLVAGVAVTLLGTAFVAVLDSRLDSSARDLLRTRVQAVAALVTVDARTGTLHVSNPANDEVLDEGTWVFQGDTALAGSSGPPQVQTAVQGLIGGTGFHDGPAGEEGTLLYALRLPEQGPTVGTVIGVLSLQSKADAVDTAQLLVVGLGLLIMAGTFLATRVLVGRALQPVAELTHQAGEWSATDVNRRFGQSRRPSELADLAATLDGVLDRLSAVLRHEQRLTGELSHELRTPLARIIAEVELLQTRPRSPAELTAAHQAVAASATRMNDILQTLLSTARGGADVPPGRSPALQVLGALVATYGDDRLRVTGSPVVVGVDTAILERIITPLVDNALRYAQDSVVIHVLPGPVIEVVDDGPGLAADLAEAVFQPGRRLSPGDGHPGAGLGLSLSRRLARASGGDVVLDVRPGHRGLTARATLPGG